MDKTDIQTAKIFMNGRSQAVRLPKAFRFDTETVIIKHHGDGVLLLPTPTSWDVMEEALSEFESDLRLTREAQEEQTREDLFGISS